MGASLDERHKRWAFLLLSVFISGVIIVVGGKAALAEYRSNSSNPEDWLRAAELEPGNADYWYRLGRYRQLDFENADLPLAIFYYRRALAINPRSARCWMGLASAYEMQGDFVQARQAFESAQLAYPFSAEVAWRYGNFLLRREQFPEALAEIRRALTMDHNLAKPAILLCWRSLPDIDRILDQALPPEAGVYQSTMDLLVAEHGASAALAIWNRLLALKPSLELRRALPLLDELIEQGRVADAKLVWQQATRAARWTTPESFGSSLVWDGGFEGEFANGGFGWRRLPLPETSFEFDVKTFHSGSRSLRITFDGSRNLDFFHLQQYVPVEPNTRYHFSAYLRTDEISTDSGVRFAIAASGGGTALNTETSNLVGSKPWSSQQAEFTTGPDTRLVKIALIRHPSRKFDNKLAGSVWVDDVSLVPVESAAARLSP